VRCEHDNRSKRDRSPAAREHHARPIAMGLLDGSVIQGPVLLQSKNAIAGQDIG
jgi:hypothetical protein